MLSAQHPFLAAMVQFALLGTLGEIFATMIRRRTFRFPLFHLRTPLKMAGWAVLGLYIKVMFLTASAGLAAWQHYGWHFEGFTAALLQSTLMNVMLGPSMVILHRLGDNGIERVMGGAPIGWKGIESSFATLLWLWIPLHTFTFLQPAEVRVFIAAVLSLLLGVVLGYFSRARVAVRATTR